MITIDSEGWEIQEEYDEAVQQGSRRFLGKIYLEGDWLGCYIMNATVTKGACNGSVFSVGSIISSTFEADIKDSDEDVKGQDIDFRIGLDTGDDWIYVTLGHFTVVSAQQQRDAIHIKALGPIAAKLTQKCGSAVSWTLSRIASEIYSKSGVQVVFDSGINTSYVIEGSVEGLTTYQALQVLAATVGGYATETYDGKIIVKQFKTTIAETVNTNLMLTPPELQEKDFEITGVEAIVVEGDSETPPTGYSAGTPNITLHNKYLTQSLFNQLSSSLMSYKYRPGSIDLSLGDPRLEAGDVVRVMNVDGEYYNVPCHEVVHTFHGGFSTKIRAAQGTNESEGIGTKTQMQMLLDDIRSDATIAKREAEEVKQIAGDTVQYFWFEDTGTDTGAHITGIPKEDFILDPSNAGGNLLARNNGIAVRDGLTELATFSGDTVQMGLSSNSHANITPYAFKLNSGTNTFFQVTDRRGETRIVTQIISDGSYYINLGARIKTVESVTVNGTSVSYTSGYDEVRCSSNEGDVIVITWTAAALVPVCVFGLDNDITKIGTGASVFGTECSADGLFAHAEGEQVSASGRSSHAEGHSTVASGWHAHAEGHSTEATGQNSHAEGDDSEATGNEAHAEGTSTVASGNNSHAEGVSTKAIGAASHAEGSLTWAVGAGSHSGGYDCDANEDFSFVHGRNLTADSEAQVVFGVYNKVNTEAALIVGNGSVRDKSNALELDTWGNLTIEGRLTQSSDRRLKEHISYLGEDAVEFVRGLKPAYFKKDKGKYLGFYAQDVEEIDTWDTLTGEMNNYKTLSYTDLIAPLVAYCQSLEARIKELEKGVSNE